MIKKILILILRQYQKYLSPDHSFWAKTLNHTPYCRYTPSCSNYMIESIEKKGVIFGIMKGVWRVIRCNPWSRGGYDPVDRK